METINNKQYTKVRAGLNIDQDLFDAEANVSEETIFKPWLSCMVMVTPKIIFHHHHAPITSDLYAQSSSTIIPCIPQHSLKPFYAVPFSLFPLLPFLYGTTFTEEEEEAGEGEREGARPPAARKRC